MPDRDLRYWIVPFHEFGKRRDYRDLLMIQNKRIGRKINNRLAKAVSTATHGCPLPILIATAIPMATAIANIARVITAMRKIARISLNHFGTAEHSRSVGDSARSINLIISLRYSYDARKPY